MSGGGGSVGRWRAPVLTLLLLTTVALSVLTIVVSFTVPGASPSIAVHDRVAATIGNLGPIAFTAVGTLIVLRGGSRSIGWLMTWTGVAIGADLLAASWGTAYVRGSGIVAGRWGAWLDDFIWILLLLGFWLLAVLFPDGRPATRFGRGLTVFLVAGTVSVLSSVPFHSGPLYDQPAVPTPMPPVPLLTPWGNLVTPVVTGPFVLLGFCLSLGEAVHRYRHADALQRTQQRWLAWAFGVIVTIYVLHFLPVVGAVATILLAAVPVLPAAVGMAMFRERLYEIDRVVSRTVSYGVLTGLLAAVYAAIIMTTTTFAPTRFGAVGVSVATLVVAALFVPARRRVQQAVDRRFDRAHFSKRATIESFGAFARTGADVEHVSDRLLTVVQTTLAPMSASVWMADDR